MSKYSMVLCHLLEFQSFYTNVKALARLSCGSSGIVCGFFVPRASLLLLHVAVALHEYYRWLVEAAWSTLVSQLDRCRFMSDMVDLHEKYVDFLLESLLVPPREYREMSFLKINPLFSEPIGLIHQCASELLRLFNDPLAAGFEEVESVYGVLVSEVSRLKSVLNVVSSCVLLDIPAFGPAECAILSDVVKARIDLGSSSCRAVSVLQRLLR